MALARPRAVVFDLDGTLVDTVETRIRAWLEALAHAGLPTTRQRLAPLIGMDGKRLVREIATVSGKRVAAARVEEIDRACGVIFERLNRSPRPLPGVRDVFSALDEQGIPWAIATSSRREQVATSVAALELERPPIVIDGGHVAKAKPEPDLLLAAARELGVPPQRSWCVGDSTWDVVAARAAGMTPIAVIAGAAVSRASLEAAGAAAVVETLFDLARLLPPTAGSGRR